MAQYRYSDARLRQTLIVATGLTVMVCFLTWMLLTAASEPHTVIWTSATGFVFFAFMSLATLIRWLRRETVVAILPTGLFDARWQSDPVTWERIREVVLRRMENEIRLDVYLWRGQEPGKVAELHASRERTPDHSIDTTALEGDAAEMAQSIARYAVVRVEA
ncbi:MAG: hypothetical protein KDJ48_12675 [Nitratireductor sp.]|nr:hypothetical protein [Nitratireductor sp.]MCB1460093.1 hypothetical protein [Nitratireductor sp.]